MDQNIAELKARIEKAEARIEFLTHRLDEARRAVRLSSIVDDQIVAINTRSPFMRGGNNAA